MSSADFALTADRALVLRVDALVQDKAATWIPRNRVALPAESNLEFVNERAAILCVDAERDSSAQYEEIAPPTLTLANVRAFTSNGRLSLSAPSGIHGDVDLAALCGTVVVGLSASTYELQGALTLSSALLLGRMERALIHAAAVVDPLDRGWLLVGDSHAGKTTTCATLIGAGWRFVADDQVVLRSQGKDVVADGWPREAHLDAGWQSKRIEQRRIPADLRTIRENAWTTHAMLSGVLFPNVASDQPTRIDTLGPADALTRIVRQSPWLFADIATAASTLSLLTRVASLTCRTLSLGRDSYANGNTLVARLSAIG